jgi:hypothetical protein
MTTPFLVARQTHSRSDLGVALRVGIRRGLGGWAQSIGELWLEVDSIAKCNGFKQT